MPRKWTDVPNTLSIFDNLVYHELGYGSSREYMSHLIFSLAVLKFELFIILYLLYEVIFISNIFGSSMKDPIFYATYVL